MTQQEQRKTLAQWAGFWPDGSDYCDAYFPLDEVHELENKLDDTQYVAWVHKLRRMRNDEDMECCRCISATAAQRCEALCRVLFPDKFL